MMNAMFLKKIVLGLCVFTVSMTSVVHAVPELDISAWDGQGTDSHTARMLITRAFESGEITAEQAVAAYKIGGYDVARKLCKKYFIAKYDPEVGYDEAWYHRTLSEGLANASQSNDTLFKELCTLVARDLKEIRGAKLFEIIMSAASLNSERRAVFQKTFGIEAIPYKPITDFAAYFGVQKQDGTKGAHPNRTYMEKESLEQGLTHQVLVPGQVMTQTEGAVYTNKKAQEYLKSDLTSVAPLLNELHAQEREIIEQGRHPFFVPVSWGEFLCIYIRTRLWEKLHDTKLDNFLFMRDAVQRDKYSKHIKADAQRRQKLLQQGKQIKFNRHQHLIAMSPGIFATSTDAHIAKEADFSGKYSDLVYLMDVFDHIKVVMRRLDVKFLFDQFRHELWGLIWRAKQMKVGHAHPIIVMSFDDEALKQSVYVTRMKKNVHLFGQHYFSDKCGEKCTVNINGVETCDVKQVLQAYRTDPASVQSAEDLTFACIATKDMVEEPDNQGVRMYYFHHGLDKKAWQEFNVELDSLLDEIRLDIVAMNKKKEYRKSFRRWMGLAGQVASTAYFASLGKDGAWYKRCGAGAAFFLSYFYMISPEW